MKVLLCLFFIAAGFATANGQIFASVKPIENNHVASPLRVQSTNRIKYYIPGLRMRKVGTVLTVAGGAMMAGAIAVYNNGNSNNVTGYNSTGAPITDGDEHHALGQVMFFIGTGMAVPGVILWVKGAKKYNNNMNGQAAIKLHPAGLSFSYKF